MQRQLNVFLHKDLVGVLTQNISAELEFVYTNTWIKNPSARALSQSLPLRDKSFSNRECCGFFSGILPEDEKRKVIAQNLGVSPRNDFALLEHLGGECAGAVTFLPPHQTLNKASNQYRKLSDKDLAIILRNLQKRPLMAGERGIRLSLAGAQDKLAVMVNQKGMYLPLGNSPSTHILKPATEYFEGLIYNEAVALELAHQMKIPAARISIHSLDKIDYLMIKRYDRVIEANGVVRRIHQEDFCQAMGIVSEMKYQNEGGPSLKQCFDLLRAISTTPVMDLQNLLDAVIFNFLIGNHDAHGKNFSLLYLDGRTQLAPFYDLICTIYYPPDFDTTFS